MTIFGNRSASQTSVAQAVTAGSPVTGDATLQGAATDRAGLVPVALLTAFMGAFVVFGVGFAHSDALHNAAHDTRHAIGFPCH